MQDKEPTNTEILREDMQVRALVEILRKRNIITAEEEKQVLSMQPFPQMYT